MDVDELAQHADPSDSDARWLDDLLTRRASGGKRVSAPVHIVPGSLLGEYRIVREIGRGGMGVVYEAVQESLGRRVALKVLPPGDVRPSFLARFRREAHAAARLSHPHVVPVFGVGEEDGVHYFAMQFVEGVSLDHVLAALTGKELPATSSAGALARKLRERSFAESGSGPIGDIDAEALNARDQRYHRNVARLGLHAAEAVAYAHSHGVLHRDLKPANLLLDARGHLWVADFGLCKLTEAEGAPPSHGESVVGTLRYMAPEQFQGGADMRSDVYSLGVTLYELLTLRPPFDASGREHLLHQMLYRDPRPPRRVDPSIPPDLETIVLKSCAKLPEERYPNVESLAADLRAYLEGRPIAARPPSALYLARLLVRRNRVVVWTALAALTILALVSVGYLRSLRAARADERFQLYSANLAATEAAILAGDMDTARQRLDSAPVEEREWVWRHFRQRSDQSLGTVFTNAGRSLSSSFDGETIVFLDNEYDLVIEQDGERRVLDNRPSHVIKVNAAGDALATAGDNGFYLYDLTDTSEAPRAILVGPTDSLAWSPDGRQLAAGLRDGRIAFVDRKLADVRLVPVHRNVVSQMCYLAERTLASVSLAGIMRVGDTRPGGEFHTVAKESSITDMAACPDGSRLLTISTYGGARLWDTHTWNSATIAEAGSRLLDVQWSPLHDLAVIGTVEGTLLVLDGSHVALPVRMGGASRILRKLTGMRGAVREMCFTDRGTRILTTSEGAGEVQEWDPYHSPGIQRLRGNLTDLGPARFDPTGRFVAAGGRDTVVRVWDTWTGELHRALIGHTLNASVAFDPQGKRLATTGFRDPVIVWDIATGRELLRLPAPEVNRISAIFDATGDRLFVARADGGLAEWSASTGELLRERRVGEPPLSSLAGPSASGRLALGRRDGVVEVWNAASLERRSMLEGHADRVTSIAFVPGSTGLVSVSLDRTLRRFGAHGPDGWKVITIGGSGPARDPMGVDIDPGGERIAVTTRSGELRLFDFESGAEIATLRDQLEWSMGVSFSPDGNTIAQTQIHSGVILWSGDTDPEAGTRLREHRARRGRVAQLVEGWRNELGSWGAVAERVLAEPRLPEWSSALAFVHDRMAQAPELEALGWSFVLDPEASAMDHRHAWKLGWALYRHNLLRPSHIALAGAAETRMERAGALATLRRARGNAGKLESLLPEGRLFLALALARAGESDEAQTVLASVQKSELRDDLTSLLAEVRAAVSSTEPDPKNN